MKGKLILIPTPIDNISPLELSALDLLKSANFNDHIVAVEELKECRRRWIRWGLDREWVDKFTLYNEHTRESEKFELLKSMQQGKTVFLMSDCGLPAFCDPGRELVKLCHEHNIQVTSTPFPNSIVLALALSGFNHDEFLFKGFLPVKNPDRDLQISNILKNKQTTIIMDTPYRFSKLLDQIYSLAGASNRSLFIAKNLNQENESLSVLKINDIPKYKERDKCEFILIFE